ncbi:hypothetical protein KIPB_007261 [Kipferlia bialata]|uniref:Uncharacterized protein n=1 Tax=Kipferlia bialata TaxID=797122 RepID=A0A9K3GJW3_9EUKA|nr:hypothetical protein KIPB_007261 [Kipferlia bialata]|eukprot:g7261.t1
MQRSRVRLPVGAFSDLLLVSLQIVNGEASRRQLYFSRRDQWMQYRERQRDLRREREKEMERDHTDTVRPVDAHDLLYVLSPDEPDKDILAPTSLIAVGSSAYGRVISRWTSVERNAGQLQVEEAEGVQYLAEQIGERERNEEREARLDTQRNQVSGSVSASPAMTHPDSLAEVSPLSSVSGGLVNHDRQGSVRGLSQHGRGVPSFPPAASAVSSGRDNGSESTSTSTSSSSTSVDQAPSPVSGLQDSDIDSDVDMDMDEDMDMPHSDDEDASISSYSSSSSPPPSIAVSLLGSRRGVGDSGPSFSRGITRSLSVQQMEREVEREREGDVGDRPARTGIADYSPSDMYSPGTSDGIGGAMHFTPPSPPSGIGSTSTKSMASVASREGLLGSGMVGRTHGYAPPGSLGPMAHIHGSLSPAPPSSGGDGQSEESHFMDILGVGAPSHSQDLFGMYGASGVDYEEQLDPSPLPAKHASKDFETSGYWD